MKYLKQFLAVAFSFLILLSTGCKNNETCNECEQDTKKLVVYTTFFPVTDLSQRIIGDKMEIHTIIEGSQEPHSFELSTEDMANITNADLIIFNGAKMEGFVDDLKDVINDDSKFLDLSQGLALLESKDMEESNEQHGAINPHTWLSVKNAMEQLDTIYNKVSSIDPANDAFYKENLEKSLQDFKALDEKFETELKKVNTDEKYFVVSHAAFNYLAKDYGLKQVAVTGISPDEEPSPKQLQKIADFVKKQHITTIFFEGKATPKVAKTLADETNTKTDTIYTMENLNDEEIEMGYIKLMEHNLDVLVKSFNE